MDTARYYTRAGKMMKRQIIHWSLFVSCFIEGCQLFGTPVWTPADSLKNISQHKHLPREEQLKLQKQPGAACEKKLQPSSHIPKKSTKLIRNNHEQRFTTTRFVDPRR